MRDTLHVWDLDGRHIILSGRVRHAVKAWLDLKLVHSTSRIKDALSTSGTVSYEDSRRNHRTISRMGGNVEVYLVGNGEFLTRPR